MRIHMMGRGEPGANTGPTTCSQSTRTSAGLAGRVSIHGTACGPTPSKERMRAFIRSSPYPARAANPFNGARHSKHAAWTKDGTVARCSSKSGLHHQTNIAAHAFKPLLRGREVKVP